MTPSADAAVLTYSLETEPSPLTVSPPAGASSIGNVTIVVSAPSGTGVKLYGITIMLPIGDPKSPGASDLTESATGLVCSAVFSDGTAWTVAPTGTGIFAIAPPGGSIDIGDGSLTIVIPAIVVNAVVGTATIHVAENASTETLPKAVRHTGVDVAKFPYGFFIDDFTSAVADVASGATATFTWVGSSGANYTIAAGAAAPVDVSSVSTWTSPPILRTTTFVLDVTAQEYGESVSARFPFTVTVGDPTYASETVVGALNAGSLYVTHRTWMNDLLYVNGPLTVDGPASLVNASATLLTSSKVNAAELTATSSFSAIGAAVTTFGSFATLTVTSDDGTSFTSTTDGLVIATITGPQGGCRLVGSSPMQHGLSFIASADNGGATFTMPVVAGSSFSMYVTGAPTAGSYAFTFIPFGAGTVSALGG